jgi:hypothetical protein
MLAYFSLRSWRPDRSEKYAIVPGGAVTYCSH